MWNACGSNSRCGLASDVSARDAKSLAMWVERCQPLSVKNDVGVVKPCHGLFALPHRAKDCGFKQNWLAPQCPIARGNRLVSLHLTIAPYVQILHLWFSRDLMRLWNAAMPPREDAQNITRLRHAMRDSPLEYCAPIGPDTCNAQTSAFNTFVKILAAHKELSAHGVGICKITFENLILACTTDIPKNTSHWEAGWQLSMHFCIILHLALLMSRAPCIAWCTFEPSNMVIVGQEANNKLSLIL